MSYTKPLLAAARVAKAYAASVDADGNYPRATLSAMGPLKGLISAEAVGGMGLGAGAAVDVVRRLAQECGSSALVVSMHYAGTMVLEAHGSQAIRTEIAAGRHITTLALSETGSRSHFWAPTSTAKRVPAGIRLDGHKSWCTSANNADSYVWSSQPVEAEGATSTIWLVPRQTSGLSRPTPYNGLGMRGNDSAAIDANGALIHESYRLGPDGGGFVAVMGTVLPIFNVLMAATSVGIMQGALAATIAHVSNTRHEHLDSALRDLPTIRNYIARMQCSSDMAWTLLQDTTKAMEAGRPDTMLRVLQCKAVCAEQALQVTSTAMRVCGGAAYRKELAVERAFRDAQAATAIAPTTDVLFDFIGKAVCGMQMFQPS